MGQKQQTEKPRQTKRQKKSDRILHGNQSKDAIMCDYAVAPVDRLVIEMDRKWGTDRLPELVDVKMAQKYGSAVAKMNAALIAWLPSPARPSNAPESIYRPTQPHAASTAPTQAAAL